MMVAMLLDQEIHDVITATLIDSRCQFTKGFITKRGAVQQWGDQRGRALSPVVVASLESATSRHVDEASSRQDRAVPFK